MSTKVPEMVRIVNYTRTGTTITRYHTYTGTSHTYNYREYSPSGRRMFEYVHKHMFLVTGITINDVK